VELKGGLHLKLSLCWEIVAHMQNLIVDWNKF
jgi:hypothetical protein